MRSDRYTKVVLTVIAVALCAIALPRFETSEVMAASGQRGAVVAAGSLQRVSPPTEEPAPASQGPRAPTSTLPLRWRVSWAALETGGLETWCSTAVAVTNITGSSVTVEVEWMGLGAVSKGLQSFSLSGQQMRVWVAQNDSTPINHVPWQALGSLNQTDFAGYALVTADDPRIMVSAFQFCRTGTGWSGPTIVSQTNIPVYPVGATAELFVAGMPAAWTPPMVTPEAPE